MFLGEYTPTLDAKGRLILPAKFREQLESAFLTSEVERCLALWPPAPTVASTMAPGGTGRSTSTTSATMTGRWRGLALVPPIRHPPIDGPPGDIPDTWAKRGVFTDRRVAHGRHRATRRP